MTTSLIESSSHDSYLSTHLRIANVCSRQCYRVKAEKQQLITSEQRDALMFNKFSYAFEST